MHFSAVWTADSGTEKRAAEGVEGEEEEKLERLLPTCKYPAIELGQCQNAKCSRRAAEEITFVTYSAQTALILPTSHFPFPGMPPRLLSPVPWTKICASSSPLSPIILPSTKRHQGDPELKLVHKCQLLTAGRSSISLYHIENDQSC